MLCVLPLLGCSSGHRTVLWLFMRIHSATVYTVPTKCGDQGCCRQQQLSKPAMQQKACAICCGFTVLVASCIMLALSFALLHPHEYGLVFNSVTQSIETEVKENGRYFLGLGRRFIKFPKKPQYVEFSDSADGGVQNGPVAAWSNDGQEIEVGPAGWNRVPCLCSTDRGWILLPASKRQDHGNLQALRRIIFQRY